MNRKSAAGVVSAMWLGVLGCGLKVVAQEKAPAQEQGQEKAPTQEQEAAAKTGQKAQGQEDAIATDRPNFTNSAQTVGAGRVQIEAGATAVRQGTSRSSSIGEALVRVGVGRRAEVRVGVPSYLTQRDGERVTGFDNALLETKITLSSRGKLRTGLLLGSILPTGSRSVAVRSFQPHATLAVDVTVSPKVSLGFNLGAANLSDGTSRFSQGFASGTVGFSLTPKTGAFAEVFAFNRTQPGGSSRKYFDTGLTYGLTPNLQLDARVGFGLNNGVGGLDYYYGAGVSRRF